MRQFVLFAWHRGCGGIFFLWHDKEVWALSGIHFPESFLLLLCWPCLGKATGFPPCVNLSIVLFSEAWIQLRFVFEKLSLSLPVSPASLFKAPGGRHWAATVRNLTFTLFSWDKLRIYQSFIQAAYDQSVVSRNFSEVLAHGYCLSLMSFSSDVKCHSFRFTTNLERGWGSSAWPWLTSPPRLRYLSQWYQNVKQKWE